jgi:hypothetical protein
VSLRDLLQSKRTRDQGIEYLNQYIRSLQAFQKEPLSGQFGFPESAEDYLSYLTEEGSTYDIRLLIKNSEVVAGVHYRTFKIDVERGKIPVANEILCFPVHYDPTDARASKTALRDLQQLRKQFYQSLSDKEVRFVFAELTHPHLAIDLERADAKEMMGPEAPRDGKWYLGASIRRFFSAQQGWSEVDVPYIQATWGERDARSDEYRGLSFVMAVKCLAPELAKSEKLLSKNGSKISSELFWNYYRSFAKTDWSDKKMDSIISSLQSIYTELDYKFLPLLPTGSVSPLREFMSSVRNNSVLKNKPFDIIKNLDDIYFAYTTEDRAKVLGRVGGQPNLKNKWLRQAAKFD